MGKIATLSILFIGAFSCIHAQEAKIKTSPAYDNINRENKFKHKNRMPLSNDNPAPDISGKQYPKLLNNKDVISLSNSNYRK